MGTTKDKFEIVAYWGTGKNQNYQFGCASLFVNGIEKIKSIQKSKILTQFILAYMCIEETFKAYDGKITNLTIVEQSDMGLKGKGQGKMKNYALHLKNEVLQNIKLDYKDDAFRCQKLRDSTLHLFNDIEIETMSTMHIVDNPNKKQVINISADKIQPPQSKLTDLKKKLHYNATKYNNPQQCTKSEILPEPTQTYDENKFDKSKIKYAYFMSLKEQFNADIEKETAEMQTYCIDALGYLAMGCVLEKPRFFKNVQQSLGAEEFRIIADNLNYKNLKKIATSIKNNKPDNYAFYSLAIFSSLLYKPISKSKMDNNIYEEINKNIEIKKTKALEQFEEYQPKKKNRTMIDNCATDYTAFGSRYIKADDRRIQVMCAQFDKLSEDTKNDIYKYFKSKVDIDLFLANDPINQ